MSHGRKLFPRRLLTGQDAGEHQVQDGRFVIESAGRYAQYGNITYG